MTDDRFPEAVTTPLIRWGEEPTSQSDSTELAEVLRRGPIFVALQNIGPRPRQSVAAAGRVPPNMWLLYQTFAPVINRSPLVAAHNRFSPRPTFVPPAMRLRTPLR